MEATMARKTWAGAAIPFLVIGGLLLFMNRRTTASQSRVNLRRHTRGLGRGGSTWAPQRRHNRPKTNIGVGVSLGQATPQQIPRRRRMGRVA